MDSELYMFKTAKLIKAQLNLSPMGFRIVDLLIADLNQETLIRFPEQSFYCGSYCIIYGLKWNPILERKLKSQTCRFKTETLIIDKEEFTWFTKSEFIDDEFIYQFNPKLRKHLLPEYDRMQHIGRNLGLENIDKLFGDSK